MARRSSISWKRMQNNSATISYKIEGVLLHTLSISSMIFIVWTSF